MGDKKESELKLIQAETKRIEAHTKQTNQNILFQKKQIAHNRNVTAMLALEAVLLIIIAYGLLK